MKDKYRDEQNKDVYGCGDYTNDYVHWLEKQLKEAGESLIMVTADKEEQQ